MRQQGSLVGFEPKTYRLHIRCREILWTCVAKFSLICMEMTV